LTRGPILECGEPSPLWYFDFLQKEKIPKQRWLAALQKKQVFLLGMEMVSSVSHFLHSFPFRT
jgi:hypothetical protein